MARGKLVPVKYGAFQSALARAAAAGSRVEKTTKDKPRWTAFIKEHNIPEAACMVHAKSYAETVTPIIIADFEDEWNGFYMFAPEDDVALKYDIPAE